VDYNNFYLLKEIAHIQAGYPFRGKIPENPKGLLSILQMKDMSPHSSIAWDCLTKVNPLENKPPALLHKGDVVFSGRGTRIYSKEVDKEPDNVILAPQLFALTPKDSDITSTYLSWYINSAFGQRYLYQNAKGSAILNITRSALGNLPVYVPLEQEIKSISDYIHAIEEEKRISDMLHKRREHLLESIVKEKMG